MKLFASALALLIAIIGALGVASPSLVLDFARLLLTPSALYGVAAVRVLFGVVLVLAASGSRMPRTLRALGILIIFAGVLTPLFGVERSQAMFSWWSSQPLGFMRAWAVLAVVFGCFVIYVVVPPRNRAAA